MWNQIEVSASEDETVSNFFSSRGIFKIRSEEEVKTYPNVLASIQNERVVVVVDSSVILLEDELIAKYSVLSFNAPVDCIASTQSGNLIICALRNGEIHGICITGALLFNRIIKLQDIPATGKTFASAQQFDKDFYLTCTNGSMYRLGNVDEDILGKAVNISIKGSDSLTFDENLFQNVHLERRDVISNPKFANITCSVMIPSTQEDFLGKPSDALKFQVLAGAGNRLYCVTNSSHNYCTLPEKYGGVKGIYDLEYFVVILTDSGHLIEVCPFSYLLNYRQIAKLDFFIDDVIVIECNEEKIELLVLTKPSKESGTRYMKFVDYPSLKCLNEFELPKDAWLIQQSKGSVNLYHIAGRSLNPKDMPTQIEMMLVSETDPSDRFKKLIAKGHLDEAEMFGRQFELCLQPIYEAKAKRLMISLSTTISEKDDSTSFEKTFEEITSLLNEIKSPEFFRNNYSISLGSRNLTKRFLNEFLKHLKEKDDKKHVLEIQERLRRLETLQILDPNEYDDNWQKFVYSYNLLSYLVTLLKSNLLNACLVWGRHASVIVQRLSDKDIEKLLTIIPNATEAFHIVQWLEIFIPIVSKTHPNQMSFITDWSIQKMRNLQYSYDWPDVGLEFTSKVLHILNEIKDVYLDVRCQHELNTKKLNNLVNALDKLSVLKKTYNLTLTLDNYLQNSIEEMAICILQRVHLADMKSLVNDFLYPIFREKGKTPVQALVRYIKQLVASRLSLSTWLNRAVVSIEMLHNEDDRLESALIVLQNSPVPWPDTVAPLIKLREIHHPLAIKINTEYEMQPLKELKLKYGWPANSPTDTDSTRNLLASRICKEDHPDMLDDIRLLAKTAPSIAMGTYFKCCIMLVKKGRLDEAYQFFKTLVPANETVKHSFGQQTRVTPTYIQVIDLFGNFIETEIRLTDVKSIESLEEDNNLMEFYEAIVKFSKNESVLERFSLVNSRFVLRRKYGVKTDSTQDLIQEKKRDAFLKLGIGKIFEEAIKSSETLEASNFIKYLYNEISGLCKILNFSVARGICKFCSQTQNLYLTCLMTYVLADLSVCNETNYEDFIDLSIELVFEQILADMKKSSTQENDISFLSNKDLFAFGLAYDTLASVSIYGKMKIEPNEMLKHLRVISNLYQLNEIKDFYTANRQFLEEAICNHFRSMKASKDSQSSETASRDASKTNGETNDEHFSIFSKIKIDAEDRHQTKTKVKDGHKTIVLFISNTLALLALTVIPRDESLLKLRKLLSTVEPEINLEEVKKVFSSSLEDLIQTKVHDVWYIVVKYILLYQKKYENCKIISKSFMGTQLRRVLHHVLSEKNVNFMDVLVMLLHEDKREEILNQLEIKLKTNQQKMNFLILKELYNESTKSKDSDETTALKRLKHFYYMELCKQDPTIKGKFNAETDDINKLLTEFHSKNLDIKLLERLSTDFKLEKNEIYSNQIIGILKSQELKYDVKIDAFGDEELVILSCPKEMRRLCEPFMEIIDDIDILKEKLKNFIPRINSYFYELFICVIEMLSMLEPLSKEMQTWMSILLFLKHKMIRRRRNRPGQIEIDTYLQSQPEMGVMPKITRYRLPFRSIVEQPLKDILSSEIYVDNCEGWFPLIEMHTHLKGTQESDRMRDFYCMQAVNNSISEYKAKDDTESWNIQPIDNSFLKAVLRLVNQMRNPTKAFSLLYFVSNYAPEGADQVEATYECYKYALENVNSISEKCEEQIVKIKRKYSVLKTCHLLHIYGLKDDGLLALVENPYGLINKLYEHELILNSTNIDINQLVKQIAELHDINLEEIQNCCLQKFLKYTIDTNDTTMLDETFQEQNTDNAMEKTENTKENVIRAHYILNSWPKEKAIQFLIGHMFPAVGPPNTLKQQQMYECLSKLNDGSDCIREMLNQQQYIATKCVNELKELGYNASVEKFEKSDKIEILKTIWERNSKDPNAVVLLSNICICYQIYVAPVWDGILKRMIMFNMYRELSTLVDFLSCQSQLLSAEGLIKAWDYVIKYPFKNATKARTPDQEEKLSKALVRLQTCPVLMNLNFAEYAELCLILQRPHMAAIIMVLCKDEKDHNAIKEKILQKKSENLAKDILDLEDAGIFTQLLSESISELGLE